MGLLDIHLELSQTNKLLERIALALERAIPVPQPYAPPVKPFSAADVSHSNDPEARERERAKIGLERNVWRKYARRPGAPEETKPGPETIIRHGTRDHDDPLDRPAWIDEEFGIDSEGRAVADNYAGIG